MEDQASDRILEEILSIYRAEPERLRSSLPEVARLIERLEQPKRLRRSPFELTERKRLHHQSAVGAIVIRLNEGSTSTEDAVRGLQHCATLIQDNSLPEAIDHEPLVKIVKAAIGKSPSSFKSKTTINLDDATEKADGPDVPLIKGVRLNLDSDMHLVSATVSPSQVKKRKELLSIVGIASDTASDVAQRHDEYMTEEGPHGTG